jgi:hypothetical protein
MLSGVVIGNVLILGAVCKLLFKGRQDEKENALFRLEMRKFAL